MENLTQAFRMANKSLEMLSRRFAKLGGLLDAMNAVSASPAANRMSPQQRQELAEALVQAAPKAAVAGDAQTVAEQVRQTTGVAEDLADDVVEEIAESYVSSQSSSPASTSSFISASHDDEGERQLREMNMAALFGSRLNPQEFGMVDPFSAGLPVAAEDEEPSASAVASASPLTPARAGAGGTPSPELAARIARIVARSRGVPPAAAQRTATVAVAAASNSASQEVVQAATSAAAMGGSPEEVAAAAYTAGATPVVVEAVQKAALSRPQNPGFGKMFKVSQMKPKGCYSFGKKSDPKCEDQDHCKWVKGAKPGCQPKDAVGAPEASKKRRGCYSYGKKTDPKCNDQDHCQWVKGAKPGCQPRPKLSLDESENRRLVAAVDSWLASQRPDPNLVQVWVGEDGDIRRPEGGRGGQLIGWATVDGRLDGDPLEYVKNKIQKDPRIARRQGD